MVVEMMLMSRINQKPDIERLRMRTGLKESKLSKARSRSRAKAQKEKQASEVQSKVSSEDTSSTMITWL